MSLAKPQSPGSKLPSFPAHWICGSYSPSWAAPTKSALLSSTVAIFRSRSGAICLYDLCWENGLWKTGHSKFLRLSSFDLQLPSSQVSQGHFFKKKHWPGKELCIYLFIWGSSGPGTPSTTTLRKEWLGSLWSSRSWSFWYRYIKWGHSFLFFW